MSEQDRVQENKSLAVFSDPFAPVRLTNVVSDGKATEKWFVEIQREIGADGKPVWKDVPGKTVGPTYRLVTNQQVREMGQAVMDKTGFKFKPVPNRGEGRNQGLIWDGRRYTERFYTEDRVIKSPQGGDVMLGVALQNSYEGSMAVAINFFMMNCVCANQFYSEHMFQQPFKFAHVGADGKLDADFDDAFAALSASAVRFAGLVPKLNLLASTPCPLKEYLDVRARMAAATKIELRDKEVLDELHGDGVTRRLGIATGMLYGPPDTYWALVNAITAVTTHVIGGHRGQEISQRLVDFLIEDAEARAR